MSAMLIACEEGNLAGLDQLAVLHRINLNIANRVIVITVPLHSQKVKNR